MSTNDWAADTPVSTPAVIERGNPVIADVGGGFVMTVFGLRHSLTEAQREELLSPTHAPPPRSP